MVAQPGIDWRSDLAVSHHRGVGRKSRAKAELRAGTRSPTPKEARRAAEKANRRGGAVQPTIEGYERVCRLGPDRLTEALVARHHTRMLNLERIPDDYAFQALRPLLPIGLLDQAHVSLGVPLQRFPASFHGNAPAHLAWGLESAVSACRLLLAGQAVGAAVVARQQLERWTLLLARITGVERQPREPLQEFIARCWSSHAMDQVGEEAIRTAVSAAADPFVDGEPTPDSDVPGHEHIDLSDGTEVCPLNVYVHLSEMIHGDLFRETVDWEANDLLDPTSLPTEAQDAVAAVCDALSLNVIQLRTATSAVCASRGHAEQAVLLQRAGDRVEKLTRRPEDHGRADTGSQPMTRPKLPALMPLTVNEGLDAEPIEYLARRSANYAQVLARELPAGRLYRDDEMLTLAFTAHRHASAMAAAAMLDREKLYYGEEFEPMNLVGRGVTYVLVAEIAALCSRWTDRLPHLAAAAAAVSSSLRSAYWLWLEDDDRAMATLRCTLEQTARIRVWRIKPEKAEKLETSLGTTPRDWLETAGWRRLSVLGRALSEFAHAHPGSRWDGARNLLTALQINPDEKIAPFTARGSALDFVATLAAREAISVISEIHSPLIAGTMRDALAPSKLDLSVDDRAVDEILNHIWEQRSQPLGPPQFV